MVQIGQTVNGYTILAIAAKASNVRQNDANLDEVIILGKKGADYVTAVMGPLTDKEWYWGHYHHFRPYEVAFEDFTSRVYG